MVETKLYNVFKRWKETHGYVTLQTGAGKRTDEKSWREHVIGEYKYYYDLEAVCVDRAAFCPKATSAQISIAGCQRNVDSSSDSGDDVELRQANDVPANVRANLDGGGLYSTPPDSRSRLTSDSSTTNQKKTRKRSKLLSNKEGRSGSSASRGSNPKFDVAATKFMNRYGRHGQSQVPETPKSKNIVAAEDAALLSTHFKTCVDNFGSRLLAVWANKDSCIEFKKFLTPDERKQFKQMEQDDLEESHS